MRARGYVTPVKTRILAGGVHSAKQQVVRIDRAGRPAGRRRSASAIERALTRAIGRCGRRDRVRLRRRARSRRPCGHARSAAAPQRRPLIVARRFPLRARRIHRHDGLHAERVRSRGAARRPDRRRRAACSSTPAARCSRGCSARPCSSRAAAAAWRCSSRAGRPITFPSSGPTRWPTSPAPGDTVIATFTLALAAGATFGEAARLANYAGGLVVMKRGTATVTRRRARWPRVAATEVRAHDRHRCGSSLDADRWRDRQRRPDDRVRERLLRRAARRATCAISRAPGARAIGSSSPINDDESVRGAEGTGPARPAGDARGRSWSPRCAPWTTSCSFRDRTVERLLRLISRTCTARARTTPSTPCPSARSCASTAAGSRSSAIRRITRRAISRRPKLRSGHDPRHSDRPAGIARRSRPHAAGGERALADAHPDAEIDWLVDAVHVEFLALVPLISSIVPLRDRTAAAWLEARRTLRARTYDVALDFQGLLKSAALARLSGAGRVIGFDRAALRERAAAPSTPSASTSAMRRERAARHREEPAAGRRARGGRTGAPVSRWPSPRRRRSSQLRGAGDSRSSRCSIPARPGRTSAGRRIVRRSWPRGCAQRHGLRSVVLWGPGEEAMARGRRRGFGGAAVVAPPTKHCAISSRSRVRRR